MGAGLVRRDAALPDGLAAQVAGVLLVALGALVPTEVRGQRELPVARGVGVALVALLVAAVLRSSSRSGTAIVDAVTKALASVTGA